MMGDVALAAFGLLEEDPGVCFVSPWAARGAVMEGGCRSFGTAASRAALRSRERFERLPGRLIPNDDHMGLDNYPVRCGCGKHTYRRGMSLRGFAHLEKEECPYEGDSFDHGIACCWLRGSAAAFELQALGNEDLAGRVRNDMTAEEALAFAGELWRFADEQEKLFSGKEPKPRGAWWKAMSIDRGNVRISEGYATFEHAIARIRNAASWFEKTSRLGFGVGTWG